jgi:hypothetical protein
MSADYYCLQTAHIFLPLQEKDPSIDSDFFQKRPA